MVWQETVNLPACATVGSIPTTSTNFRDMQAKHPGRALEKAVKGMLPKGPLGYAMIKKLKVYGGAEHPHTAQQPKLLEIPALAPRSAK